MAERMVFIRRTGRGVGERATISTEWPIVCRARIVLSAALASPLPRASAARFVTTSVFNPLCILARSPSGAFAKWGGAFGLVDFWVMPERPRALVTGITGQDGSYLAELLIEKGYEVHGLIRRSSSINTRRIDHLYQDPHESDLRLILHYGDMSDATRLSRLINEVRPQEVYNLGAQSHVKASFEEPEYTSDVDALGTLRLLDALHHNDPKIRLYQASTSQLFGSAPPPQSETTPFHPRSPYGVSKLFAYWIAVNYREAYGLFASNGILFNHESPRRGETFVSRKITRAVGRIVHGLQDRLYLGNLDAKRDWGYAKDYVDAMWRMLQNEKPEDFVVATGV